MFDGCSFSPATIMLFDAIAEYADYLKCGKLSASAFFDEFCTAVKAINKMCSKQQLAIWHNSGVDRKNIDFVIAQESNIISQIVFDSYYSAYQRNCEKSSILRNFEEYSKENSDPDSENKRYQRINYIYKKTTKRTNFIATINDATEPYSTKLNAGIERFDGLPLTRLQLIQLARNGKYRIIKHVRNDTISRSKAIDDAQLIGLLKEIDNIYNDIDEYTYADKIENAEFFLKSIDYHQLECSMLFEQNYLVAKALSESGNKLSVKKTDKEEFKHLQWCVCEIGAFQNRFIIGKSEIIELYNKDRFMIDDIKTILLMMNLMRYCIVQMIQSVLNVDMQQLMCPESEGFFKGYFGEGQHIERNKEWNSIKLKDFRDMYVPDIPLK